MKTRTKSFFLFVGLLSIFSACDLEDPDVGIPVEDIISLRSEADMVLANGEHTLVFTAELGDMADPNLTITFNTSAGEFLEASSEAKDIYSVTASGKVATATLISSTIINENVVVSASVTSLDEAALVFQATKKIVFTTAYPDDILLTTDQTTISPTGTNRAELTASLFSEIGQPSQDLKIDFRVIELDSATVSLPAFAFTGMGTEVSVDVKSENLLTGQVAIIAEIPNLAGEVLRDTVSVTIEN